MNSVVICKKAGKKRRYYFSLFAYHIPPSCRIFNFCFFSFFSSFKHGLQYVYVYIYTYSNCHNTFNTKPSISYTAKTRKIDLGEVHCYCPSFFSSFLFLFRSSALSLLVQFIDTTQTFSVVHRSWILIGYFQRILFSLNPTKHKKSTTRLSLNTELNIRV